MRIAIPADENELESNVCISFARTPYFIIYDTESDEYDAIDNSAIASSGGAGVKAAQAIVDDEVDILITPRCGANAAEVMESGEIEIYKSIDGTVIENLELYMQDKLSKLDEIHEGFHGHGGN